MSERRDDAEHPPASQMLEEVRGKAQQKRGERITLGELFDEVGGRVYGLALLLFAVPEGTPFVTAGWNTLFAIPLFVLSGWMIAFGLQPCLPGWLRRRSIKRRWAENIAKKGAPWLRRAERFSRPRLERWASAGRALGAVCFALTTLMVVPIPLTNVLPAWCVITIGFGIFQRDGLIVLTGLGVSATVFAIIAYLLLLAREALV